MLRLQTFKNNCIEAKKNILKTLMDTGICGEVGMAWWMPRRLATPVPMLLNRGPDEYLRILGGFLEVFEMSLVRFDHRYP